MSASAHNYLVSKLSSARDARESARTSSTNAKLDWAWIRWIKFLTCINLQHDELIDEFKQEDQVRLLGAFAQAIREREFSCSGEKELARDICQEAVDKWAEVFRANRRPDPSHDLSRVDTLDQIPHPHRPTTRKIPRRIHTRRPSPTPWRLGPSHPRKRIFMQR